ncbi:MAG: transporter substrate-binding domain-containing protein [Desulfuromonadales bacterium]
MLALSSALGQAQTVILSLNQDEAVQDVAAELLTEIYKRAGLTAKIEPSPPARNTDKVLKNQIDGEVARVGPYFDKNPRLIKVEPAYYHLLTSAFAKNGRAIVVNSPKDLHKYRVGIIRGVAHAAVVTEGVPKLVVVNSVEQLFEMLELNRIDVAVDVHINGLDVIRRMNLKDVQLIADLAKRDFYNALIPSKADLAPGISKVIKEMITSGELSTMIKKAEKKRLNADPARKEEK